MVCRRKLLRMSPPRRTRCFLNSVELQAKSILLWYYQKNSGLNFSIMLDLHILYTYERSRVLLMPSARKVSDKYIHASFDEDAVAKVPVVS